jgi:hypothetical protein
MVPFANWIHPESDDPEFVEGLLLLPPLLPLGFLRPPLLLSLFFDEPE